MKPEGEIQAAEDSKIMLGEGDKIYLTSFGEEFVDEGQWVVFKTMKDVYHPKTEEPLGDLVNVLGIVEVTHVNKNRATAQIIHSKEPISRTDYIVSVKNLFQMIDLSDQMLPENTEGTIVEVRDNRMNNAQHDIVYIDYGRKDGVVRGDRFSIIHGGQRNDFRTSIKTVGLPQREVGELVILSTQDRTATARIVESVEPISKGDSILFLSSR
jgi:chemotaxis protein MotB